MLKPWIFPAGDDVKKLIDSFDQLSVIVAEERLPWWTRLRLWLSARFAHD